MPQTLYTLEDLQVAIDKAALAGAQMALKLLIQQQDESDIMRPKEIAAYAGNVSVKTVYRWFAEEKLTKVAISEGMYGARKAEVDKLLQR